MILHRGDTVLVAEPISDGAAFLANLLQSWGRNVCTAANADEVLQIVRRQLVQQAVVATELAWADQMLLTRLAALPSLQQLVAIGPGGEPEIERLARLGGADVFLSRPVLVERLAQALNMSSSEDAIQKP